MSSRKTVLSIAGSDPSGGAGIQADLKTMDAYGIYGMSVVTAVTAQNTCGVTAVEPVSPEMVRLQLEAVFQDILPDAVKIGMLCEENIVSAVVDCLKKYKPQHVILDPVMVSTSGKSLLSAEAVNLMLRELFPLTELITPNIPEAEQILGRDITTEKEMEKAAEEIAGCYHCHVLLKGGHMTGAADDLLYHGGWRWYPGSRIRCDNTHGTGCTLSSAIASGLAQGMNLEEAVLCAKEYVRGAMSSGLNLGQGNGPLDHLWQRS